jgi:hypothetical protein
MRRHPNGVRLFRGHPGGGQYDVLWIMSIRGSGLDVRLNRTGTIQIHCRADGGTNINWEPTSWVEYLASDHLEFIRKIEEAAGWRANSELPSPTPTLLTYQVLAALVAFSFKVENPIWIEQGYIDTSGYGGGPNGLLAAFAIPEHLTAVRDDDMFGEPGYRFWMPVRAGKPLVAIEQTSATAWFLDDASSLDLTSAYLRLFNDASLVAAEVLKRALISA